jgi:glutathione S-transferase
MSLQLYAHPFSSYCQKVLTALYENDTPHALRKIDSAEATAELQARWPMVRMPILVDGDTTLIESSVIIEYLDLHHPGKLRFVPADAKQALDVRFMDRVFDNYVMTPMQHIVFDFIKKPEERSARVVADARTMLDRAYPWLEQRLAGREWAAGDFSLADCAAGPSLFYADWVQPIPEALVNLRAYRARLLARPSFARAVDEARPYRKYFPPGAPDRD